MTSILFTLLLSHGLTPIPDVVSNVRQALTEVRNQKPWSETILRGETVFNGVAGKYVFQFQPEGSFYQSITGPLGQTFGSDGKSYWLVDRSGAPRHLSFEDVDRVQALILLLTNRWLDPTAHVNATLERPKPSQTQYRIHFKPRGTGLDEYVTINPKTWLPTSAEFEIASSKTVVELSDWKEAGNQKLPGMAKITNEGLTDTIKVTSVTESDRSNPGIYLEPQSSPNDHAYDSSIPSAVETKRAASGHVLVHPLVNGKDVGWFILDSGAESMVIDPATADSLKLPKVGKEAVVGVGGTVQEPFRTADRFTLGPATMRGITFIEIDLHQLSEFFKVKISGIVGFDFFRRYIVRLELSKPSVQVENVDGYRLPSGIWSKILFSSGNPAIQASFEGDHQAWFRLDTGANGSVTFHSPTVESLHLLENRETTAASMAGVGGSTDARVGHLSWFELGGKRFEKVEATFSLAKAGAFADRYLAGNIGQDLMEPVTMVFEFGGSRVAFLPR